MKQLRKSSALFWMLRSHGKGVRIRERTESVSESDIYPTEYRTQYVYLWPSCVYLCLWQTFSFTVSPSLLISLDLSLWESLVSHKYALMLNYKANIICSLH